MSATQSEKIMLRPLESLPCASDLTDIHFVLRRPGVQAYVMVSTEAGKKLAFEKMSWKDNAWRLSLQLGAGTYRYRYYVSNGSSTAYFSPSDADRVGRRMRMEGIDGLFDVLPADPHPFHAPCEFELFTLSLRPGISSLPISCEGAFF